MGFYLVSAALLAGSAPARRNGVIAAVAAGAVLGVVRLAQGGHFLSDVIASGFLVGGISWGLHGLMMTGDHLERLGAALRRPSPGLKRFALLTVAAFIGFAAAYAWIDIPLARSFQGIGSSTRVLFGFITRFGEGGVYLVPLGLVFIGARWKGAALWASRSGFLFAAIAIPGIFGDIMKPIFGRARPALLFREDLFGFAWRGAHANNWSFPSGHSITVSALAVALYTIHPPLWPVYALLALLVMTSRIVLDQHYLSDVIAGGYIGVTFAWALTVWAQRHAVPLRLEAARRDSP